MRGKNRHPGVERTTAGWRARYYDEFGKRHARTFKTQAEAIRYKQEQERLVELGSWIDPRLQSLTIGELVDEWVKSKSNLTEKTWATYESQLRRYILPNFGDIQLRQLRSSTISEWLKRENDAGSGPVSVNKALGLLHQVLEFAVLDGRILRNPASGIQKLPKRMKPPRLEVIDRAMLAKLLQECAPYEALIITAGFCGMRWSELTALRCYDVNLEARVITVSKAHSTDRLGALVVSTTKTKQTRMVPMSEPVARALEPILLSSNADDFLFKGPTGGVLHYKQFMASIWKPAVTRLGIENFGFHGLRRTCASLLISMQTPITAVSAIVGHASVRTTLDAYAHFYEIDKVIYVNKIAEGF